jgi:Kelch motif
MIRRATRGRRRPRSRNARYGAAAARLGNGKVLVTGGSTGNLTADSEIYDPVSNSWTAAAPIPTARIEAVAAPLPNGKVLVTSGNTTGNTFLTDSEIYDPGATRGRRRPRSRTPATGRWRRRSPTATCSSPADKTPTV